jgi:radical SAM protein with 4Fe4S-binding SPASM domain
MINKIRRYWRTGLSYGLGLRKSLGAPINVHIETTNICNFRCIYCPQSNPDEHFKILGRGKMPLETFKQIIDKVTGTWNVAEIILTRDGEPLVHPQLEDFIGYCSEKQLDVTIGSNGSYFSPDRVKTLIENGLTKVKGDFCTDKAKYEELRRNGNWQEVYDGYRNLIEYSLDQKKKFHLIIVDLNTYDLSDKEAIAHSLAEMHSLFPYPEEYLSINPAMMHNSFNEASIVLSSSNKLKKNKYNLCHHPWIELVIDYKGNAVGCCRDLRSEYIIGNVLESDDLQRNIWNGEKMRHLRTQLAKKSPESINTCSKCDLPYGVSYAGRGVLHKYIRFLNR